MDLQRLLVHLERVSLPLRHVFYQAGAPIEHVYFIEDGLASLLTSMADGATVEIGMIGPEGVVGIAALFGATVSAHRIIVQVPVTALRMPAVRCKAAFDRSAAMRRGLLPYAEVLFNLSAQTAACNSLHSVEQRCARWLLISSDRIGAGTMPMTHEFLSSMLGVRRVGVTTTLGSLERAGVVRKERARLSIIDRPALEAVACECYRADRAGFDRLL